MFFGTFVFKNSNVYLKEEIVGHNHKFWNVSPIRRSKFQISSPLNVVEVKIIIKLLVKYLSNNLLVIYLSNNLLVIETFEN